MSARDRLRLAAAIALPIVIVAVALYAADNPRLRYSLHSGPCFKQMAFHQSGDIDYLAVGGSRMLTAFDPYIFQRMYRAAHGTEVTAYNMARSWFGPDYAYPMLRDLLERRKVRHLILMASYQRGNVYNPLTYSVSTNHDLLSAFDARPHKRVEHFGAWLKMFLLRVRDAMLGPAPQPDPPRGARTCYLGDGQVNVPRLARAQREFISTGGFRQLEFDIGNPTQEYAVFYYRRIVELAEAHGTQVTFVRMPLLAGARWTDETAERFEEVVGAPLVRLPVSLRTKMAMFGYRDRMHLNGTGREMFLPWLVDVLPASD